MESLILFARIAHAILSDPEIGFEMKARWMSEEAGKIRQRYVDQMMEEIRRRDRERLEAIKREHERHLRRLEIRVLRPTAPSHEEYVRRLREIETGRNR